MVRTDYRILAISPLLLAFGVFLLLRANAAEPTTWIGRSNTNAQPEEIVHRARQTNVLPEPIYADNLKTFGVNLAPRTLIERASFEFIEMRDEMQVLADQVARQEKFPSSGYRNVIRELKKRQEPADAILPGYMKLRKLRARTELALRGKFNQKAFHDFLLRQGLLPPELLEKVVANEFIRQ